MLFLAQASCESKMAVAGQRGSGSAWRLQVRCTSATRPSASAKSASKQNVARRNFDRKLTHETGGNRLVVHGVPGLQPFEGSHAR